MTFTHLLQVFANVISLISCPAVDKISTERERGWTSRGSVYGTSLATVPSNSRQALGVRQAQGTSSIALTRQEENSTALYDGNIHRVSKNVPPLICYNFDKSERILTLFSRNATDKVRNQKTLYYAMHACQITCVSALPGKMGNTKIVFFTRCISALPQFNQSLFNFFNLFDLRLILTLLYDCLNLVINAFSLGLLGDMVQEKGSREHCSSWTACVACTVHQRAVFWVSSFAR